MVRYFLLNIIGANASLFQFRTLRDGPFQDNNFLWFENRKKRPEFRQAGDIIGAKTEVVLLEVEIAEGDAFGADGADDVTFALQISVEITEHAMGFSVFDVVFELQDVDFLAA